MKVKQPGFTFIVGEDFKDNKSLAEYKKLKKDLGYHVDTININKDLSTPDEIREKLQELLKSETVDLQHALIIGDVEQVDSKKSSIIRGKTDHYHRALDTDKYEEDINGPDIGVGRLTVTTDAELDVVIEKLTKYQKGGFSNLDWVADISFIATDDYTFHKVAEGSHNHVIENYTSSLGYMGIFPAADTKGGEREIGK